jgi:GNAT superfamily N-acetyltransferase
VARDVVCGHHGPVVRIRGAAKADGPRLVEFHAVVHDLHGRHRPDVFVTEPNQAELQAFFGSAIDEPSVSVLVAELRPENLIAGYALVRVVEREGSPQVKAESAVMLEQLAVDPVASRRGVGTALLEAVRAIGREAGCRRLITNVWCFNTPADRFMKRPGWCP